MRRDPLVVDPEKVGCDFLADGPNGETHLEIKGPVDSKIKAAKNQSTSIPKQGKRVGNKAHKQVMNWCSSNGINMTRPANRDKVLVAMDLFDVSSGEKQEMEQVITKTATKEATKDGQQMQNIYYSNNQ